MSVSLAAKAGLALVLVGGVVQVQGAQDPVTQAQFLDRLAARVERAKTITPETRDALTGLVDRSLTAPARNYDAESRRQLAIIRLEIALRSVSH